ncbi:MAG: phosphoethanolamine transferase, partial [Bacteroidota bacterium]
VTIVHHFFTNGPLTASSIFTFANTNGAEAHEFMELKSSAILILIVVAYILLFLKSTFRSSSELRPLPSVWLASIPFVFSIAFLTENGINGRFVRKGIPQNIEAGISYFEESRSYASLSARKLKSVDAKQRNGYNKRQLCILVIGESCTRNHMSLYGYQRETNPLLSKRNDLWICNNVISSYATTIKCVLSMLSESNMENKIPLNNSLSLFDVFSSAGYKTHWISNQSPIGIWDNTIFNLAKTANSVVYTNNSSNSSLETTLVPSYDQKILPQLKRSLDIDTSKNKFIGIHLMGSHISYNKRYPAEFDYFKGGETEKEKTINQYDNSIRYNDFVLNEIIEMAKDASNRLGMMATVIYVSDHGENVFDIGGRAGHDWAGSIPNTIVEIPLILWTSNPQLVSGSEHTPNLANGLNRPFKNDDVFHLVLDLMNIETASFDSTRSLFNAAFVPRKRMLEDGRDYDLGRAAN